MLNFDKFSKFGDSFSSRLNRTYILNLAYLPVYNLLELYIAGNYCQYALWCHFFSTLREGSESGLICLKRQKYCKTFSFFGQLNRNEVNF
ncbi:hypothetical protein SAMN05421755_105223 [Nitrosomonas sp. Nm33]|nr:hypothetical protein SAMN05421755_105223 [Nitrosomonas sp. Nm33]